MSPKGDVDAARDELARRLRCCTAARWGLCMVNTGPMLPSPHPSGSRGCPRASFVVAGSAASPARHRRRRHLRPRRPMDAARSGSAALGGMNDPEERALLYVQQYLRELGFTQSERGWKNTVEQTATRGAHGARRCAGAARSARAARARRQSCVCGRAWPQGPDGTIGHALSGARCPRRRPAPPPIQPQPRAALAVFEKECGLLYDESKYEQGSELLQVMGG